jgi:hypothetical protein
MTQMTPNGCNRANGARSAFTGRATRRADMSPSSGPLLGPFDFRSEALAAEHSWLETNWLGRLGGR